MVETRVITPSSQFGAIRNELMEVAQSLGEVVPEVQSNPGYFSGYDAFAAAKPSETLAKANRFLSYRAFKIAVAGGFSGGKSSLINELLGDENLLPDAVNPETAVVTVLRKATTPQQEKTLMVQYLTDEEYRSSKSNLCKRFGITTSDEDEILAQLSVRIEQETSGRKKADLKNLKDFTLAHKNFRSKLGTSEEVYFENKNEIKRYATDVGENKLQLMMMKQIVLYADNPLLDDHVEIIDLPGTDSVFSRDKDVAMGYLQEVDALITVSLGMRPLAEDDEWVVTLLEECKNTIRDKVFFVLSQVDRFSEAELAGDKFKKIWDHVYGQITSRFGIQNPRIYFCSAYASRAARKKEGGQVPTEDLEQSLARMGKISRMKTSVPGIDAMLEGTSDGGVRKLRQALLTFFKREKIRVKFGEIVTDLLKVAQPMQAMMAPVLAEVEKATRNLSHRKIVRALQVIKETKERIQQIVSSFDNDFLFNNEFKEEFDKVVMPGINAEIGRVIEEFDVDKYRATSGGALIPVSNIKFDYYKQSNTRLTRAFSELVSRTIAEERVYKELERRFDAAGVRKNILGLLPGERDPHRAHFLNILENLWYFLKSATRIRAMEEAWSLQQQNLPWEEDNSVDWNSAKDKQYRATLKSYYDSKIVGFPRKLKKILWEYYQVGIHEARDELVKMLEDEDVSAHVSENIENVTFEDEKSQTSEAKAKLVKRVGERLERLIVKLQEIQTRINAA